MIPFADGVPFDAVKVVMLPFNYEEGQLFIMAFLYNTAIFIISFVILANDTGKRFSMNDYVLTRVSRRKTGIKNLTWCFKTAISLSGAKIIADLLFSNSHTFKDVLNEDFWFWSLSFFLTALIWNESVLILKSLHVKEKNIMFSSLAVCIVAQAVSLRLPPLGLINMVPATFESLPLTWILAKVIAVLILSFTVVLLFEKYESVGEIKND